MPNEPHDLSEPTLTAYALGEITAPAHRAAIEQHLEQNPDAADHVQQVRDLGADLEAAFADESATPTDALTPAQHDALTAEAHRPAGSIRRALPYATAACLLLAVGLGVVALVLPDLGAARRSSRQMQESKPEMPERQQMALRDQSRDRSATPDFNLSSRLSDGNARRRNVPENTREIDGESNASESISRSTTGAESSPSAGPNAEAPASRAPQSPTEPSVGNPPLTQQLRRVGEQAVGQRAEVQQRQQQQLADRVTPNASPDRIDADPAVSPGDLPGRYNENFNTEGYDHLVDNPFRRVREHPLSTFSVDVDTASYANVRRFLTRENRLPPAGAVRIEEMINYFDYGYAGPTGDAPPTDTGEPPFAAHLEVAAAPWAPDHRLVRIGIQGWAPPQSPADDNVPANLVFLLDVSGSMDSPDKLPLLKDAFVKLTDQLDSDDRVSVVVYAGASGLVLDGAPGSNRGQIRRAIDTLQPGGSTQGSAGIELAYEKAAEHFIDGGVNRVLLATDGDFNVGVTNQSELVRLIEEKARTGVYLSVLGFGTGNVQDGTMEQLSNHGDGNYAYIDSAREAEKILVRQAAGTLRAIAKDVKLQVEFNPARVQRYRLIGYANRILDQEDFNDDTVDAGDIGAGHSVTALYEIVPTAAASEAALTQRIDAVRQRIDRAPDQPTSVALRRQLGQLRARYDAIGQTGDQLRETRQSTRSADADQQMTRPQWVEHEAYLAELERLAQRRETARPEVDDLTYQQPTEPTDQARRSSELLTLKLRYKAPDADKVQGTSELLTFPVTDASAGFDDASEGFRFASSVAAFGMLLRDSDHAGDATYDTIQAWAADALGDDPHGDRAELLELIRRAASLDAPADD